MRSLYRNLDELRKTIVLDIMRSLFDVRKIESTKSGELLIFERSESFSLEVMLCGSALQKVLSGLILLTTLISCEAETKFFLVEEIEALLYPSLVVKYFQRIRDHCIDNNIKLLLTSNSREILDSVNTEEKICLSLEIPGEQLLEASLHSILGFSQEDSRPVLICDGSHDKKFLERFLPAIAN